MEFASAHNLVQSFGLLQATTDWIPPYPRRRRRRPVQSPVHPAVLHRISISHAVQATCHQGKMLRLDSRALPSAIPKMALNISDS